MEVYEVMMQRCRGLWCAWSWKEKLVQMALIGRKKMGAAFLVCVQRIWGNKSVYRIKRDQTADKIKRGPPDGKSRQQGKRKPSSDTK